MDEKTPHIHAAVVPIVTGEKRKAPKEQEDGKRKYRKKTNFVRLCADDLFNRQALIATITIMQGLWQKMDCNEVSESRKHGTQTQRNTNWI